MGDLVEGDECDVVLIQKMIEQVEHIPFTLWVGPIPASLSWALLYNRSLCQSVSSASKAMMSNMG